MILSVTPLAVLICLNFHLPFRRREDGTLSGMRAHCDDGFLCEERGPPLKCFPCGCVCLCARLQIPAVQDFGLFMALIVSCCWLWVCLMMPAALGVWSRCLERREGACLRRYAPPTPPPRPGQHSNHPTPALADVSSLPVQVLPSPWAIDGLHPLVRPG